MEWLDELTLIAETTAENRVNKNGFAVKLEESTRTVFCNKKSVGYSEYFKSQQTGKLVEAKYEVHKADYGGEDVVEVNGRRYFVLKTYDTGTDTIELTVNITEWMKTVECQRIIFNTTPSDTAEYWGTTTPIDDDVVRSFPKNGNDHAVYAICKRAATDILEHLQICGEVKPCVFRHFMVYGWHPVATYFLEGKERMLPWRSMVRKCIQGENLEVYGDVTRKKELLYIKDFARAVVIAANNDACGIFNLPGYEPYSLDSMVDGIMNAFADGRTEKHYRPDMPDTPQILLAHEKSKNVLGWEPVWTWEKACMDMRKECIENPMELLWGKNDELDQIK